MALPDPAQPGRRTGLDDTHPKIRAMMIEAYRRMPPHQKLQQVDELTRGVQEIALIGLRSRHPEADDEELRMRLAALWVDAETMRDAYGWPPEATD